MVQLTGITDEPMQMHTIPLEDDSISLHLRFYGLPAFWCFDVKYKSKEVKGVKLSLGTLHLESNNLPFDFALEDTSKTGIDPFRMDDFSSGRINIYMLEPAELREIRGYDVPI
jgi:hypothetical protein